MTSQTMLKVAIASTALALAGPASAADLLYDDIGYGGGDTAVVVKVHSRGYRHCHWIDGDRVCHRRGVPYAAYYNDYDDDYGWDYPYYGGYGYGWGPGIVLGFGGRGGHYHGGGGHRGGGWSGGGHGHGGHGHGGHGGRR